MGRVDRILRLREPARGESRNKESGGRTSRSSQPKARPPLTEPPATVRKCYVRREMNKRREKNSQAAVFFLDVVRSR